MRIVVDGEEYVNGDDFEYEFCAGGSIAALWREQGMPFIYDDREGVNSKYLYPVRKCHAWFAGEEVEA